MKNEIASNIVSKAYDDYRSQVAKDGITQIDIALTRDYIGIMFGDYEYYVNARNMEEFKELFFVTLAKLSDNLRMSERVIDGKVEYF